VFRRSPAPVTAAAEARDWVRTEFAGDTDRSRANTHTEGTR